jgi:hypothetical protein
MKYLLYIGVLLYVGLSTSIAEVIGIGNVGTYSWTIIILLGLGKVFTKLDGSFINKYINEFRIIVLAILIMILKLILGQYDQIKIPFAFAFLTMLFSILLQEQKKEQLVAIRNLIIIFFICECSLAVYEVIFQVNVFPSLFYDEFGVPYEEEGVFRSTALIGNPLSNAWYVSIMMVFILISDMKVFYRIVLLLLGFFSILCFNARGLSVIWLFLIPIYFFKTVQDKKIKLAIKLFIASLLALATYFFYIAVVVYNIGGRLVSDQLFDESAKTRFNFYKAFSYLDSNAQWYGNSAQYIPIMNKLETQGVENSIAVFVINYGYIVTFFILLFYYIWFKNFFKSYTLFQKFMIFCIFFVHGFTANSMASYYPWAFMIIGFNCFFTPEGQNVQSIDNKTGQLSKNKVIEYV